jgi:hypothetical protein
MASAPPFVNFERHRPDYVGLSPGTQRKILLTLWDRAPDKLGQWAGEFRDLLAHAAVAYAPPLENFEHDRPDVVEFSPVMEELLTAIDDGGQGELDLTDAKEPTGVGSRGTVQEKGGEE